MPPAQRQRVDLELVIATDTSISIDIREATLQRRGIAAAFRSPELIRAIQNGAVSRIAVAYVDWSSVFYNRVVVDWQTIQDATSASAFADALLKSSYTYGEGTSIGGVMEMAADMIDQNAFEGTQRTIDISGDGPNNFGRPVAEIRDEIAARDITINGLPIVTDELGNGDWGSYYGDIAAYYSNCVIGGRRALALPARGFQDFATAVRRKLVLEISDASPSQDRPKLIRAAAAAREAPRPAPLLRPAPNINRQQALRNCNSYGEGGFR